MLNFAKSNFKKTVIALILIALIGSFVVWKYQNPSDENITVDDFRTDRTTEQVEKGNEALGLDKKSEQGACIGEYEVKLKNGYRFCTHGTD